MDEARRDFLQQDYQAAMTDAAERLRATIAIVQSGLQNLTLINGGALIALFTLVAAVSGKPEVKLDGDMLWLSFASYAAGLSFTVAGLFGAFFSQDYNQVVAIHQAWNAQAELAGSTTRYPIDPAAKIGRIAQRAGVACAALALVAFMAGSAFALAGVVPGP